MTDLLPYIVIGLLLLAVPLTVAGAVVKLRRDRAAAKPVEPAPVVVAAAPPPDAKRCPCGGRPTRGLPRVEMTQLPLVGRWWRRVVDGFAEPEVCGSCGRYADAALDERIAEVVALAKARMEREIAREVAAYERSLLEVIVGTLPTKAQSAWRAAQRTKTNDETPDERTP